MEKENKRSERRSVWRCSGPWL